MKRLWLVGLLLLGSVANAANGYDSATYRDVLLAAIDLRDQAVRSSGRVPTGSTAQRQAVVEAQVDVLASWTPHLPPAVELLQTLAQARARLNSAIAVRQLGNTRVAAIAKDIGFPEPDVISECTDATASAAHAMLEAWDVSSAILAAAKWACLQTEAGTNGAAVCTVLAVETEVTESEYQLESFCLGAQRDATVAAVAETQESVAGFLNQRADATLSSRATQASIDGLQNTLSTVLLRLSQLRAALIEDDNLITQALGDVLDEAMALAAQLAALSADVHDVQFRTQAVQVDLEDIQRRLADVQTQVARLATDVGHLRSSLLGIQSALTLAQSAHEASATEQRDRRLATALGDPDMVIIRYRFPVAHGGELERSREVLIRTVTAFEALGADSTAARALLASGDNAYNQGRPLDAYDHFARAYRLLLGASTMVSTVITKDSFE